MPKEMSETEASALRREILADAAQSLDLTKFAIVATTAFIGFALTAKSCLLALLGLLVVTAARGEIINRKGNTLRIATYLQIFGGSTICYENRLWQLRILNKKTALKKWSPHPFGTFHLLALAGYASVAAFSYLLYVTTLDKLQIPTALTHLQAWLLSTLVVTLAWFLLSRWQHRLLTHLVEHGKLEEELRRRWQLSSSTEDVADQR